MRIARLFRPYRGRLAAVGALIGLSALAGVASPFLLRAVLDQAIPQRDTTLLALLVGGMVAVAVVNGERLVAIQYETSAVQAALRPDSPQRVPCGLAANK